MANRKSSNCGSGCLTIVVVIVIICILCSMCSSGGGSSDDDVTHPTSTPSSSVYWSEPATDPTTEPPLTSEPTEPTTVQTEPSATQAPAIEFVSWPNTIARGSTATVKIKGEPNTKYTITVYYKSGAATAAGLEAKTSDSKGYVSWTWQVGGRTSPGTFRITVSGGGASETVYFTVTE